MFALDATEPSGIVTLILDLATPTLIDFAAAAPALVEIIAPFSSKRATSPTDKASAFV